MQLSNNQQAFLALVRAGVWEEDIRLSQYGEINYSEIYRLSEEQSVVGLVAAGLEHIVDVKVPQEVALTFVGAALQLEQRNLSMNRFIEELVGKLRNKDIYALLVKGQSIAQCYERPLWRASGDVDLLLSNDNYKRATDLLKPTASSISVEEAYCKHIALTITPWEVELHGNLRSSLCKRIDRVLDEVQNDIFYKGNVRSWQNGHTQIFSPGIENDVVFVFSHILEHFFRAGVGYRQICDWCRLLYKYHSLINLDVVETRLRKMRLLTEWKSFAYLAVNYLGMPEEMMPFYSPGGKWKNKASRINSFVMEVGNFGHNRDYSYFSEKTPLVRKLITMRRMMKDSIRQTAIFPMDAPIFFLRYVKDGISGIFRPQG